MEIEVEETADKNKPGRRSAVKKPKHKNLEATSVEIPTDNSSDVVAVAPKKELFSIYSHRNEENVLVKNRPGKRSVTFSNEPVQIELAAPRTFTRNYIKANTKKNKKKDITSEGLYMLMKNPEVLQRLDNADGSTKPLVKPADQSTPDSDLSLKINLHDQVKISFYKPPIAGSWVPPDSTKDGSDGESNSSGESSEENVYVVGQSEHDEECLNILSNGLDEDEENDSFFNKRASLIKETNIDDVIFSAKMTEVIENSSPKKFKETSLIETHPVTVEESEESEESSLGSVDSGIHEAGTDHDSPVEEAVLPPEPQKPLVPPKPTATVTEPSKAPVTESTKAPVEIPEPAEPAPKPQVIPKPKPQAVDVPKPKPQLVDVPKPKPKVTPKPKPQVVEVPKTKPQVAIVPTPLSKALPQTKPMQPVAPQPKPLQQVLPQPKPPQLSSEDESESSDETESESEESETSSISSNDRPPSPVGHEMTYLQYDEEPMLPKYKKDLQIEKKRESLILEGIIEQSPVSSSPPKAPTPDIPKTSLENFFSLDSSRVSAIQADGPGRGRRNSELMERHEMEQRQLKEIQRLKHIEEQHLREIQIQQQIEQQKLDKIQAQQHIQRQMEIKRQQELQLQIERQQLEELQRHRELQQIQEMQRTELKKIQEEERRREVEAERQRQLAEVQKRQLEIQKQHEFEHQIEQERQRIEQERQVRVAKQKQEEEEKQRLFEQEMQARLAKQKQEEEEKQRQFELLRQIEAEKHRQFEAERQRQKEAEKRNNANNTHIQKNTQLNADFEDIDSLLEGLMELDPIINQQSRQQNHQQFEEEARRQREEEARRQREEARALLEEKAQKEQDKLDNERRSVEEAERKKQAELEATRERKRKMREMSLDDVLKLQKNKKKGSPTPSIRSETVNYATLKRNSNESLNSVTASLDRGATLPRNQGGNQMIAPISLLHEIINPYTHSVQEESPTKEDEPADSTRTLPVIVDNLLISSPNLPPRTDLASRQALDLSSVSSSSSSNRAESDASAPIDLTAIKTKLESQPLPPRKEGGREYSPNTLGETKIVTARIEAYGGPQRLAAPAPAPQRLPAPASNIGALSPNSMKAKQQEQWLDIDDLLADVQSMITYTQPAVPPRSATPSSQSLQPSPRSINTSTSSYNEVFDSNYTGLAPPRIPGRSNSPNPAQQPPVPVRTFTSSNSTPPLSPRGTPPRGSPVPSQSPPVPSRLNQSEIGRSNSDRGNKLEHVSIIPRANSEGSQFKRSAFQNFQPTPNPHEDSIRRKSSIDDLNRRTQQLSLQRNQSTTGSFRAPGVAYPLSPQPQEYMPPTNVTVPFYQQQKMYKPQSPPQSNYASSPPPQYTSPPPPPTQSGNPPPLPPYTSPPINQVYPQNRNTSPPPLPRRHKVNNSKHHTTV